MSSTVDPAAFFDPLALPPEPVKRFTVGEYQELIRLGFLTEDDPYELLEGWLVHKMTKNPPHEFAVEFLNKFFQSHLSEKWRCRCQQSITLADGQPEPDIAIVGGVPNRQQHPLASEARLVIEVADTSLARDRTTKLRSYARAAIPEYWIVNVEANEIEVFRLPTSGATYTERRVFHPGDDISLSLDDETSLTLAVRSLFEN